MSVVCMPHVNTHQHKARWLYCVGFASRCALSHLSESEVSVALSGKDVLWSACSILAFFFEDSSSELTRGLWSRQNSVVEEKQFKVTLQ